MREPLRVSGRHWWNAVMVVIVAAGTVLWAMGLLDGRWIAAAVLSWILAGWCLAREILYEHLGFLNRHVFHDYSKARSRYRKAVDTKKATVEGMCALASLCYSEGDAGEAARLLEEAMTKRPGDPHMAAMLSRALTRLGRYDEAIATAAAARGQAERALHPVADLALAQALKAKGEMIGAASAYQRAAETAPRTPEPRVGLAEIYLGMGDAEAAGREAEKALEAAPTHPDALYWAGKAAEARGDRGAAGRFYRSALGYRPIEDRSYSVPYRDIVRALSACSKETKSLGEDVRYLRSVGPVHRKGDDGLFRPGP